MPKDHRPTFKREAFHFFLEHAGYAIPPGRVECAATLARAERWAKQHGIEFQWDNDDCGDLSEFLPDDHTCKRSCEHEVLFVAVDTITNGNFYSLGGILDPTSIDRRVFEAEIAAEVMFDLHNEARKLTEELLNGL